MNQKEHEPKRARIKNSTNQKVHKPKRAQIKNSTNQIGHEMDLTKLFAERLDQK